MILHGDCLEKLKTLEANSVDALVTDPPAGISFMGKAWDDDKGGRRQWIDWMSQVMSECMRVMKPGAHGLVWAIPRTSHWTATALEDAGFEIRDVVTHLFGSGFPKSLDISKAMDKAAGAEREVIGVNPHVVGRSADRSKEKVGGFGVQNDASITAPATDLAKEWQGWGTALKPASEHWILVRKPLSEKNVAKNVEKWGVGGINIDGCRIEANANDPNARKNKASGKCESANTFKHRGEGAWDAAQGRFPANLVLSHSENCTDDACDMFDCPVAQLDEQSGISPSNRRASKQGKQSDGVTGWKGTEANPPGDSGGASRFFYVAKPSKRERNAGCEDMPDKLLSRMITGSGKPSESVKERSADGMPNRFTSMQKNNHPTVKPIKLMRYLIRMITPEGGLVLDPFTGSGTTGVAAVQEGMRFLGIEREAEYIEIAKARMEAC